MIQVIDMGGYYDIYSDAGKKIVENESLFWNTDEENHIAVDKERYHNGDYVESDENIDVEEEEDAIEEINE